MPDPGSVSRSGQSRLSSQQVPLSPYNRQPKVNGKRDSELKECGVTGQGDLDHHPLPKRPAELEVRPAVAHRRAAYDVLDSSVKRPNLLPSVSRQVANQPTPGIWVFPCTTAPL